MLAGVQKLAAVSIGFSYLLPTVPGAGVRHSGVDGRDHAATLPPEKSQRTRAYSATQTHQIAGKHHIPFGVRIVMVTVQYQLIERCADLPFRSFEKAQANIPRIKINSIQYPRNRRVLGQYKGSRRMGILAGLFNSVIFETQRIGQGFRLAFVTHEKRPAVLSPGFPTDAT